jgi:hypothetical protein
MPYRRRHAPREVVHLACALFLAWPLFACLALVAIASCAVS